MARTNLFGPYLRQKRIVCGIPSRDLSIKLGRNDSYISQVEGSVAHPSDVILEKICSELNLNIDEAKQIIHQDKINRQTDGNCSHGSTRIYRRNPEMADYIERGPQIRRSKNYDLSKIFEKSPAFQMLEKSASSIMDNQSSKTDIICGLEDYLKKSKMFMYFKYPVKREKDTIEYIVWQPFNKSQTNWKLHLNKYQTVGTDEVQLTSSPIADLPIAQIIKLSGDMDNFALAFAEHLESEVNVK